MPQKWRIYHDSTDDSLSLGCFAYSDAECTDWHYIFIKVRKHEVELSTNGSIILSDEFMYQLASAINEAKRTKFLENGDRVVIMDTIDELLKDTNFYSS